MAASEMEEDLDNSQDKTCLEMSRLKQIVCFAMSCPLDTHSYTSHLYPQYKEFLKIIKMS